MDTRLKMDLIDNIETKALKELEKAIDNGDIKSINDWMWILTNLQKIY